MLSAELQEYDKVNIAEHEAENVVGKKENWNKEEVGSSPPGKVNIVGLYIEELYIQMRRKLLNSVNMRRSLH